MAFTFDDTSTVLTLRCDPGHASEAPLSSWAIRPLRASDRNAASADAGPVPHGGRVIHRRIAEAMQAARDATFKELRPGGGDFDIGALTDPEVLKVAASARAAETEALEGLDAQALEMVREAELWTDRFHVALAGRVVESCDGVADVDLGALTPASLRGLVVAELIEHAAALAELGPKARTDYAGRSGSPTTPSE